MIFKRNTMLQKVYEAFLFLITDYSYEVDQIKPIHGMEPGFIGYKNIDKEMPYVNVKLDKGLIFFYIEIDKNLICLDDIYKFYHIDKVLFSPIFYSKRKNF